MVVAPGDAVVLHGLPSFQGFNGRRHDVAMVGGLEASGRKLIMTCQTNSPLRILPLKKGRTIGEN